MPTLTRRLLPLFWATLTVAVVGVVVWIGLKQLHEPTPGVTNPDAAPAAPAGPALAKVGHDYYVLVKLVEFNARKPNGSYWDRGTNTTPDPKALLYWHGQQVYALPTRDDQFIATWDLFRVNLKDVALSGGNVDIASSINAPILRVEPGEKLRVEVYDADVISDDLAMKVDLRLDELAEGDNDVPPPPGSGVRRMVVQVIDRQTSLADLITLAGKR